MPTIGNSPSFGFIGPSLPMKSYRKRTQFETLEQIDSSGSKAGTAIREVFRAFFAIAFLLLGLMPSSALAQSVNQYILNEGASGGNDINNSTSCSSELVKNIIVGDSFTISNVSLGAFITHSWRGDIRLRLRSPSGTEVQIVDGDSVNVDGANYNVLLDDSHSPVVNSDPTDPHSGTAPNPPSTAYQHNYRPNNALSSFNGENSLGTWQLRICDLEPDFDDGNFQRADLYLTDATPSADLSLSKSVSNTSPVNGANVTYSLTVANNANSALTATAITVQDTLPAGVSYESSSGTGSYSDSTGVWTVGSLAPGASATIDIIVSVTAAAGATIVNSAEISASSAFDSDSIPNNGSTAEDDDDTASFTVAAGRLAGTPPTLICPNGNTIFDWDTVSWPPGSISGTYAVANLGSISFAITNEGTWLSDPFSGDQTPVRQNDVNGGFTGQHSLFQLTDMANQSQEAITTITLPVAVDGVQFTIFDVDHNPGGFADQIIVSGSYNGNPVIPTLTNGIANYVIGNGAYGDAGSGDSQPNGNVVVTFSSPVDTITIVYSNHNLAPADPAQQAIALHDMTFCIPVANLAISKISTVLSDGVSASNPKAIPGAIVRYCILVSNMGSAEATDISVTDSIPSNLSFVAASLQSSDSCSGTMIGEDEDSIGADENDPYGMSFDSGVVTGSASSLALGESVALIFNVTIE